MGDIADIMLKFIEEQEKALGIEAEKAKEDIRADVPDVVESQHGNTMLAPVALSHPTLSRTSFISSSAALTQGP